MQAPVLLQIKASAGSGKTYSLTRRFLALLGAAGDTRPGMACAMHSDDGYSWPDIMAVTFTNRAATEMKERVVRRLKELALRHGDKADKPWTPAMADMWVNRIIRHYSSLNIRTIDSLLTLLVRLSALDLDLPPDFEPAFAGSEFFDPLMDDVLERARHGDTTLRDMLQAACESLLFHTDHTGFTPGEKLRGRLSDLLDWHLRNGALPHGNANDIRARIVVMYDDLRDAAVSLQRITAEENLDVLAHAGNFFKKCAALQAFEKFPASTFAQKTSLDECLKKASLGQGSAQAEAAFLNLMRACRTLQVEGTLLRKALTILPLVGLAEVLADHLPAFQLREGKVPSQMLPLFARRILDDDYGVSEAFCRMGTRLAHILIDEFQDTSRDQWAAIKPLAVECLSRGGSLTWVGDIKQAIYSWRGGDSALFDEILGDHDLRAIVPDATADTLPMNWRSRAEIIQHNNAIFGLLGSEEQAAAVLRDMLPEETPPEIFDAALHDVMQAFDGAAQRLPDKTDSQGGYVSLTRITRHSKNELEDAVQAHLDALFNGDLAQRRAWRDVAVLVRTNGEAELVATWLMQWDIPVVTENSLRLGDHPLVRQTISLLAFLDYPRDDLAFWEFASGHEMFGSVAGLDGQRLDDWLAAGSDGALFTRFRQDFPHLWERWIAPFYSRAGLMSAYDTVREIFYRYGVFERYPEDAGFLRRFLEVVHAAEGQGLISLSTFLDFWKRTGGDEKVPMPEGMDAVRVMTMHKSKGLEFPVVVIPFHQQSDRSDDTPVRCMVEGLELLVPLCPEMGAPYYEAKAHAAREKLHLLYVAWTRPVDELHAFITDAETKRGGASLIAGINRLMTLAGIDETAESWTSGEPLVTRPAGVPQAQRAVDADALQSGTAESCLATGGSATSRTAVSCVEDFHLAVCATSGSSGLASGTVESDVSASGEPPASEATSGAVTFGSTALSVPAAPGVQPAIIPDDTWRPMQWLPRLKIFRSTLQEATFTERQRGMLVHSCLEALRLSGQPHEDAARAVRHGMRAFRLPIVDPQRVEDDLTDMLGWLACQPDVARWMRYGTPEQDILDADGKRHRTDLLVDDGTTRTVVEYKTGNPTPDHALQVRRYLSLLAAMNSRLVHGVLVYLDLREIRMVSLEAEMPEA